MTRPAHVHTTHKSNTATSRQSSAATTSAASRPSSAAATTHMNAATSRPSSAAAATALTNAATSRPSSDVVTRTSAGSRRPSSAAATHAATGAPRTPTTVATRTHAASTRPSSAAAASSRASTPTASAPTSKTDELTFVHALKQQHPIVEHNLEKLHLAHRYDTTKLRARVSWYRNSFEDVAAPFVGSLCDAPRPIASDPPLVIPHELRPLGLKQRYLRTMQLAADPVLPDNDTENARASLAPFEATLRQPMPTQRRHTLHPAASQAALSSATPSTVTPATSTSSRAVLNSSNNNRNTHTTSSRVEHDDSDSANDSDDADVANGGNSVGVTHARRRAKTVGVRSKPPPQLLDPLRVASPSSSSSHNHAPNHATRRQHRRGAAQHLSIDEIDDLPNHNAYFGDDAKQRFFTQYRNLYTRPYLFVSDSPNHPATAVESQCVAAFPSTRDMERVAQTLAPYGAAVASSSGSSTTPNSEVCAVPTRDALSPRSLLLTASVLEPQLAVPFILRHRGHTKVFDFSFQALGDALMTQFAQCIVAGLPFVHEILVRDNRLSDAGLNALLLAIADGSTMLHLVRLDISQNEVGAASAETLRSYVASPHCTLATLLVENADIDDRECAAFMDAFAQNLSIQTLCLRRNRIGALEHLNVVQPAITTGGEAIASMLQRNLVLVYLDLSWNYLRLASSVTLAASLQENHTLRELHVAYNACGDAGAMAFGEALQTNVRLEVLDLSANSIGARGAVVLAHALRVNRTLRLLRLNGNSIGRAGAQRLLAALCANESERGCDVELRNCNLATLMTSSSSSASSLMMTSSCLPNYNSHATNWVFDPKEPTGHYALSLGDAYGRTVVMELVRLATFCKGCRFVKVAHAVGSNNNAKFKPVQLLRRERTVDPTAATATTHRASVTSTVTNDADGENDDNSFETRGLDALFAHIDCDRSGTLDESEVLRVLNRIGLFPHIENLRRVLATCDHNHSGGLEAGEFSAFLFHAVFQLIDVDASGKIDADEMDDAFALLGFATRAPHEIAAAIATYDISGDGEIEASEFVEFMRDCLLERVQLQLCSTATEDKEAASDDARVVLLDAATQRPWIIPTTGRLDIEFIYEREAFASTDEALRLGQLSQRGVAQLVRNITQHATASEQDELFDVAVHDSEIRFTASQAFYVLEACGYVRSTSSSANEQRRLDALALVLPQMLTVKDAQVLVAQTLTIPQRYRLKTALGSAYSVVLGNPTAHYNLDLTKPKDRVALAKIAEVAQSEKLFSKFRSGRADTSQHGNWENFRNATLDGQSVVLSAASFLVLPRRGKLAFDYVSTTRPKRGTTAMSARRFEQLIRELQARPGDTTAAATAKSATSSKSQGNPDTDVDVDATQLPAKRGSLRSRRLQFWERTRASLCFPHASSWQFVMTSKFLLGGETREDVGMKLVQIESAVCDRWLSCEQAAQLVACMPSTFGARAETARILFARLIDVANFGRLVDALAPEDQRTVAQTLGWLNICNPMTPERKYELDVSVWDEREMTKLLVELAIAEPGENWINQSFAAARGEPGLPGWKLPVRWEKDDGKEGGVNRSGYLEVEYYSGQDRGCAPVPAFRKTLLKRTLCGTRQYCL